MTMPLVSVVIPCYNQGTYLADAVGSVLRQTYIKWEVIVVDDGSSDRTREVAAQFGDRITYIHQRNRGVSAARNAGIRASRGEFIVFLDADDWLSDDYLERQIASAARHPAASVHGSDCRHLAADGSWHDTRCDYPAMPSVPLERLLLGNPPFIHSHMVRRSAIDRVGAFDERLPASEDPDFWIRMAAAGELFVAGCGGLAVYRQNPTSMTKRHLRLHHTRLRLIAKHRSLHRGNPYWAKLLNQRLAQQRDELFQWLVKPHVTWHRFPTELSKLIVQLARISLVDPAFVPALAAYFRRASHVMPVPAQCA